MYDQIIYPVQFDESSPSFTIQHAAVTDFNLGCNVVIDNAKENESDVATVSACTGSNSTVCISEDKHFHTYAYTSKHVSIDSFYKLKKALDDCTTSKGMVESENTILKEEVKKLKKQLSASEKRCNIMKTKLTIEKLKSHPAEVSLKSINNDQKKVLNTGFANNESEAMNSQFIDCNDFTVKTELEESVDQDFNTEASLEDVLKEDEPQTIKETGYFYIQMQTEGHVEFKYVEHNEEEGQETDPLNNSLVPPADLLYSCDLCSYQGNSTRNFAKHKSRHNSEKKHQCGQCDYRTQEKLKLVRHQSTHSGVKKCSVYLTRRDSSNTLPSSNESENHTEQSQYTDPLNNSLVPSRVYSCNLCSFQCESRKTHSQHKRRSHSSIHKFQCDQCGFGSETERDMDLHLGMTLLPSPSDEESFPCDVWISMSAKAQKRARLSETPEATYNYKCIQCDYVSRRQKLLDAHVLKHSVEYACDICPYKTTLRSTLIAHIRCHSSEKMYKCELCDYDTHHKCNLKNHMNWHIGITLSCDKCPFTTLSRSSLNHHKTSHTHEKKYKCRHCDYRSRMRYVVEDHERTHTGERPFICEICGYASRSNSGLYKHKVSHSTGSWGRSFLCSVCGSRMRDNQTLVIHMRTHTGERPFACDACEYTCSNKSSLIQHQRNKHSLENTYQCSHCDYKCKSRASLVRHRSTHSGALPFACGVCEYTCDSETSLVEHQKMHSSEKIIQCSHCGFKCQSKGHLAIHNRTHSGERPFACDICKYTSTSKGGLVQHKKCQHSLKKPFQCSHCEYKCFLKSSLLKHMRFHSEERPFACDLCSFKSGSASRLTIHKKIHLQSVPSTYQGDQDN